MSFLKKYLLNVNLFEPPPDSREQEDDQRRRSNIIATRIYILILILTLFGIGLGLLLIDQTTIITIKNPSREQFEALPMDAQCSCSRISLPYGNFTSLQTSFHQVCSSNFVTDRWFEAINSGANSTYFSGTDFRTYGSAQFQALAGLCRLSKASIDQSVALFYLNALLSPQLLSENVLRSQIQASIDQFQLTAPNTFKAQLRLVEEMIGNNRLQSGLQTNAVYEYYNGLSGLGIHIAANEFKQVDGSWCYCNADNCNNVVSRIYNIFGAPNQFVVGDIEWLIPGISSGCLPVSSILVSTLECFYDQTCLNKLISYFSTNENFTALNLVEQSQYSLNSTVQSMVDKLMLEDLMINISYDNYYSQCAPASCTYSKVSRHNFLFILTKLIYLLAGLTLILRLVIPSAIRLIQRLFDRTPRPSIPLCVRLRHFKAFIQNKLIGLNIFSHYPSSDRQIRYQRYASRLYIFLILISISFITIYTLLETSTQSKKILNPTQSQYEQLQQVYPETLSCSCNSISISYFIFITIQPHYHQLCSSDLVSEQWNTYLQSMKNSETLLIYKDYRYVASNQFLLLTMMCQQAQETIDDGLQVFLQTQFVSPQVISQESFEFQVNSLIEDWKSITVNTFMRTFQLVRATEQGNQLTNTNGNAQFSINSISRTIIMMAYSFSGCNCGLSPSCCVTTGIYDYDQYSNEFTEIYSIPNFFIGCYLIESLLSSTLECFYNISCMLEINSYSSSSSPFNFSALDPSLNSPNETIELIVDQLMVDTWSSNVSFTSYYNTCAPLSCTFQYEDHNNLFIVITTITSVFGGLLLGYKLIILIGLQFIDKIIKNGFSRLTLWHCVKYLFTCKTEHQMIHRLHFILVVTILYVLYIYSVFSPRTITVEIMKPSLSMYKDLVAQSYDSLECPCTQISIKYESFLNIEPRFHEVCSSDFVSDQWITYVYGNNPPVYQFSPTDFLYSASGQFQLLASFCQLSQETVNDSLSQLGVNDFINTELLSSTLFDDRIQTTINQFQLTMPNLFVNTLSLIRETTGANMLMSVLSTSWILASPPIINNGWTIHTVPLDYEGCSCALSSKCVTPSRGMLAGCYPLEAILQTTLECLYDQQCIDSTNTFTAMNISSLNSSRFPINTTIELIVNQLMIEEFISNISYESYFNQCAPLSCTYTYVDNHNIIEGITTLIGLYGGLVIICRLIAIFIVKRVLCMRQRVSPITN